MRVDQVSTALRMGLRHLSVKQYSIVASLTIPRFDSWQNLSGVYHRSSSSDGLRCILLWNSNVHIHADLWHCEFINV